MNKTTLNKVITIAITLILVFILSGCANEKPVSLYDSLTKSEKIFALIVMIIVTILVFYLGISADLYKDIQNKFTGYLVNLLVSCLVGLIAGGIIALLGILIWHFLVWIIQNILMIAIVLLSLFLLLALVSVASSENYGAYHEKTNWIITSFVTAVIIGILIAVRSGIFPAIQFRNMTGNATIFILVIAFFLILLVVTLIKSLSGDYFGNQTWWFIGALSATIGIGIFLPVAIEKVFTGSRVLVEGISLTYIQYFMYGSIVGIIFFPSQLGRAFYKIFEGDDLEITHTHKPSEQNQYKTIGYQCGNCGKSLSESVSQCPYCGVRFGGTRSQYLGAPPKPTTTTTRNTTPFAGFSMFILLLLDMLYGVSLFGIRQKLTLSDTTSLVYIFGGMAVNLIIIGIAVLLMKKYTKLHGRIEKVSYY